MSETDFQRWVCDACGYIYDEAKGDPDSGLAPGTRYDDIPDDWYCPLCGLAKSDLRLLPEPIKAVVSKRAPKPGAKSKGSAEHVVIVGAGVAGWSVAEEIRQRDPQRPILLVSACEGIYYPKPALSTAIAQGKSSEDLADSDALSKAAELGIEVRSGTRVIKFDTERKKLTTAKGAIQYGQLVLALGAQQRQLPLAGDAAESVMRVNDLGSYRKLRHKLEDSVEHVTILGAGLIGCEFAEDLRSGGYAVSVIDPQAYPLASLLPERIAGQLQSVLQDKGVDWKLGLTLTRLDQAERLQATLSDGSLLATDLVISAAGLIAQTQLADKAGLATADGIVTNTQMQTSVTDVYALGDCAEVEGQIYAYIEPIRRQAKVIAEQVCGATAEFESLLPLVRVKTPSFPLSICKPTSPAIQGCCEVQEVEEGRLNLQQHGHWVGFVLSGTQAGSAMNIYRELQHSSA